MVVPKNVRIKIRLKVKRANRVINAVNATLDSAPKGFHSVDMGNATNILLGGVLDYFMGIAQPFNLIVAGKLIGKDNGFVFSGNLRFNHREQYPSLDIGDYLCDSVPLAFNHSHDNRFAQCTTTTLARPLAADVGFVNLNLPGKRVNILSHEIADFLEYAPCCLVGDTQFPLELLGGDACFGGSQEEYGVKPRAERGIRFVKDSASRRGYMRTAELTGVDLAGGYPVVGGDFLTLVAVDSFGKAGFFEEVKASVFIRKLLLKISDSVGFHVLFSNLTVCLHYSIKHPCCQGIIAKVNANSSVPPTASATKLDLNYYVGQVSSNIQPSCSP